jgi:hypothetical protein
MLRGKVHFSETAKLVCATTALSGEFLIVAAVSFTSALTFLYFLGIALLCYRLLVGKRLVEPLWLYAYYAGLMIALFGLHYVSSPEHYGFTAAGISGTDDSFFYSLVADDLPSDFPLRSNFAYHFRLGHPYAALMKVVAPFPMEHPFDILFFNAVGALFIPVFTGKLAVELSSSRRVGRIAFVLSLICPFILANSLILIRDGWTAALYAGGLYFFVRKEYVKVAILTTLLFFIRIASGAQLLFAIGIFTLPLLREAKGGVGKRMVYAFTAIVVGVGLLYALFPILYEYAVSKELVQTMLFRADFVERLATAGSGSGSPLIYSIYQQPVFIRVPLATLYFIALPFFAPDEIWVQGVFIPRAVLACLFAILFVGYFKYLLQGMSAAIRQNKLKMKTGVYVFLSTIAILSQASMQWRHKVMLMPLLYVIVAYGYYNGTKLERQLGVLAGVSLFALQLLNLF